MLSIQFEMCNIYYIFFCQKTLFYKMAMTATSDIRSNVISEHEMVSQMIVYHAKYSSKRGITRRFCQKRKVKFEPWRSGAEHVTSRSQHSHSPDPPSFHQRQLVALIDCTVKCVL